MSGEGFVLRLERRLSAPREVVYGRLTDPTELARWWGPKGFTVPAIDFEPTVGRSYRISMQPPEGELFYLTGEFLEVEPPATLAFTFRWEPPHEDDRETTATLALEELEHATMLRLTQGDFTTPERHALHEGGWTVSIDRLEELLRT
jgi:uncharacterized protein YndB with AHSA1/START domain